MVRLRKNTLTTMPPLTEQRRREIDIAITAGREPRRGQSNVTTLATGAGERGRNKFVILAGADAKLTPAGRYFYETTGQRPPTVMYDRNQEPVTRGNRTFIRGRDGREILVRSYRPDGAVRVTRAGQDFYKDKHTE